MSINSKIRGTSSGPNLPMNTNCGLQKAEKGSSTPPGYNGTPYTSPKTVTGGASAGGSTSQTVRGGVEKANKKKADARSVGAYKKAKSGARGLTRKSFSK